MSPMNIKPMVIEKFGNVEALAKHLGKSRQHISSVVNGQTIPSRALAIEIAKALDWEVRTADLLELPDR